VAAKDSVADTPQTSTSPEPALEAPKKRRARAKPKLVAVVDDDETTPPPVVIGSLPPKLVVAGARVAEPISARDEDDDEQEHSDAGEDLDEEVSGPVASAPKRARRRPRVEHVSQPPVLVEADDDDDAEPPKKRASKKAKTKRASTAGSARFAHLPLEITGIVVFALGVLVLLSLVSFASADTAAGRTAPVHNWIGPGGALLADLLTLLLGVGAFAMPLAFFGAAVACFRPIAQPRHALLRGAGALGAAVSSLSLLHLALHASTLLPFPAGGLLGALVAGGISKLIAPLGTMIVSSAVLFVGALIALDRPVGPTTRGFAEKIVELVHVAREKIELWREERRLLIEEEARLRAEIDADADETEPPSARKKRIHDEAEKRAKKRILDGRVVSVAPVGPSNPPLEADEAGAVVSESKILEAPPTVVEDLPWSLGPIDEPKVDGKIVSLRKVLGSNEPIAIDADDDEASGDDGALRIVERVQGLDPNAVAKADAAVALVDEKASEPAKSKPAFLLPPLNLLDYDAPDVAPLDEAKMRTQADKLIAKFKDFGIEGRIREIRPGPVCTTYELVPAPGIKVSKIAALADDIAMAMEAIHVRIVAPIPGKGAVGIEIPNEKRETVYMKEIIADAAFGKRPEKLMMALGKDIEGRSYYANLAEMPHVLIAGTTGSGKSVSVNAMICSILYRATPEDVKFLMIDPKMLELSIYEGIPHLLLPPIIDSKKAALALRWAVNEMERRYQLMSELGVRDIAGFNERLLAAKEGRDDEAKATLTRCLEGKPLEKLPFVVIVVDEYADLLAVAGKDVETYVMRLAQKARAAGLHVMLATQRPSVDVITGVIKANFPVRMGFRLASSHDSKTIINRPGAEKLLGRGDMLFMPPGTSNVLRVHGAFISEKELHRVVEFLKSQGKPDYDMNILTAAADDEGGEAGELVDEPKDARYDEAVAIVARTKKCSTSWLQRMMNLGYQRAARIVDRMEREGLVGPAQNAKGDREIYVKPEQLASS
jgi:S-DNA-T family DNA segregation ATPase FtsK/SpoIIIE